MFSLAVIDFCIFDSYLDLKSLQTFEHWMREFIFQPTDNTICLIQNVTLPFGELKFNLVKNKLT